MVRKVVIKETFNFTDHQYALLDLWAQHQGHTPDNVKEFLKEQLSGAFGGVQCDICYTEGHQLFEMAVDYRADADAQLVCPDCLCDNCEKRVAEGGVYCEDCMCEECFELAVPGECLCKACLSEIDGD